ncbi:Asp23/Gls24 family envelope stress response protein [Nesterenkonia sp. E16_7]|uniref:Asp23/Gls24 family envelope stress response protein n=1 Tax=unclassified Nesterenkonia TaxID=2629769 RepID=UPI001A91C6FD|nr:MULTISPECIES: Asp23/Gls24 family envelope stress response protein [unclassified Nesterenkonia]MBO0595514.1 Asp23/Gls24 family envelope stress response protein [Nesterenkonia sp. E16_10]MBO0599040.1 Asp23/Gls24 family envelope stress response protein [Nesterenkonia sp. E16_7]
MPTEGSAAAPGPQPEAALSPLVTDRGSTTVEEIVVRKLAGLAARRVSGVHALGSAARRSFEAISERIPGSRTQAGGGVAVEKGDRQAAVDLIVIVEFGAPIVEVARNIRREVVRAVEQGTGLQVLEVNILVADVHIPGDEEPPRDADRALR